MSAENSSRIDADAINARTDIVELIGRHVELKKRGREYHGLCPFHNERTPSFTVNSEKGFFHCFGCGAHGSAIGFVMDFHRVEFVEACRMLDSGAVADLQKRFEPPARTAEPQADRSVWVPLLPVPDDAPDLLVDENGRTLPVWNPKSGKFWAMDFTRADAYRDSEGRLLGYVMRVEFDDRKITPTVTWCVGPNGVQQWCVQHFPVRRPLLGLDALAEKPQAPVLIVEGEKCRAAGAGALPMYAVIGWPGGSKGIAYVDWEPLAGRDIVLWPDADEPGRQAMIGWTDASGAVHRGVAQHAHRIGAKSIRIVDTHSMPKGWDIADAFDKDGWTPQQLAAWAASRVQAVEVRTDARRMAR